MEPTGGTDERRAILQGVYEDNLRTVRHGPASSRRRTHRVRTAIRAKRPAAATAVAAVLLVATTLVASFVLPVLSGHPVPTDPSSGQNALRESSARYVDETLEILKEETLPDPVSYGVLLTNPKLPLATLFDLQVRTIVIDPGHGGRDPGAIGPGGLQEKDVTLDVARRLRNRLEAHSGYRILMTREADVAVSLKDRVAFANSQQADLFVSIHVNELPVDTLTVLETFYFGPHIDEAALRLAEKENRDSYYSVADFDEIIKNIGNTMRLQESRRLAASVQASLVGNVRRINPDVRNWGVRTAPFVVLLGVEAPSILGEISCLSNREEEARLQTEAYREGLARFLEEGITRYLKENSTSNQTSPLRAEQHGRTSQDTGERTQEG